MTRPLDELGRARPAFTRPDRPDRRARWIAVGIGVALVWLLGLAGGIIRGASRSIAATDYVYTPEAVTIALGDTVSWTFAGEPHTVTSGTTTAGIPHPDGRFDSGIRLPGDAYVLGPGGAANPFRVPGSYPYYCAVHAEQMTGTIVVQAGATPASTQGATPAVTAATTDLSRSLPQVTATPSTASPDQTASVSGPLLIVGLVGLGALAVAIGLVARRARS